MSGHDGTTPAGAMVGYADPEAGEIVYATPAAGGVAYAGASGAPASPTPAHTAHDSPAGAVDLPAPVGDNTAGEPVAEGD
jgi:hypothetical protein